jgi:nuclease-like protein
VALAASRQPLAMGMARSHWLELAARSTVGARSDDEVRRQLAALESDGWRMRHSLRWRGPGDVDSAAIAPSGIAFAIETKTRTYDDRHLSRVREQAAWLRHRRRRWCRRGACRSCASFAHAE